MSKAKDITVTVTVKPDSTPPYEFSSDVWKDGVMTFANHGHPGFVVNFVISNADSTGYFFPDDASMAVAARLLNLPTDDCPPQGSTYEEFTPLSVSSDNKTLVVSNPNSKKQEFGFALFVTKTPHSKNPKYLSLDPIGSNQNGPSKSISSPMLLVLGSVAVLGLALYTCSRGAV